LSTVPSSDAPVGDRSGNAAPAARRILAQALFEMRAIMRNGEQLLLSILLPVGALVALATTQLYDALGAGSDDHLSEATAAALPLAISATSFAGQAIATGFDRRYGVLRQLSTTPLGAWGLVVAKIIAVYAVVLTQFLVLFVIAATLGFHRHVSVLGIVLAAILGTAALVSLALLLAGTLRAEATLALANIVWVVMAAAGGVVFDPPGLWGDLVAFLPFGALGEAMRSAVLDATPDWTSLVVLAVWAIIGVTACKRWFSFDAK
jgi:ABC-2 type transport system permease protein